MRECIKNLVSIPVSLIKGMVVTFKNLITKAITFQYPTQKLQMKPRYRGLVDFDVNKCIVCHQCVKICPTACLSLTHKENAEKKKSPDTFKYNMEFCCFCGFCEQVCPTKAVFLNKIYEVAAFDHEKLWIDLLNPKKYDEWANPTVK